MVDNLFWSEEHLEEWFVEYSEYAHLKRYSIRALLENPSP